MTSSPSLPEEPRDPLLGTRIDGRYLVQRVHVRGGMSVIYAALHEQQQREVAIKVLDESFCEDFDAVERFIREARVASALSHGHVVGVSDSGKLQDGRPYLVMPLIAGTDLATLLAREGPMPPKRVAALLGGVASALDALHEKGLVHRDIKSENLMHIRGDDGEETALLLDFGIAAADPLVERGWLEPSGTPEFMAPEVLAGGASEPASDVYALATVAFELMTGKLPFEGADLDTLLREKGRGRVPTLSTVSGKSFPAAVEAVVARGLAREQWNRQRSAGKFVRELAAVAADMVDEVVEPARKPDVLPPHTLVGPLAAARDELSRAETRTTQRRRTELRWQQKRASASKTPPAFAALQSSETPVPEKDAVPAEPAQAVPASNEQVSKPSASPARNAPPSRRPPPKLRPLPRNPAPMVPKATPSVAERNEGSGARPIPTPPLPLGAFADPKPTPPASAPSVPRTATLSGPEPKLTTSAPRPLEPQSQLIEDTLRPPPEVARVPDLDEEFPRPPMLRRRWAAYVVLAAAVALGFVALRRPKAVRYATPQPAEASQPLAAELPPPTAAEPALAPSAIDVSPAAAIEPAPTSPAAEREPMAPPRAVTKKPERTQPAVTKSTHARSGGLPLKPPPRTQEASKPSSARSDKSAAEHGRSEQLAQQATDAMLRSDFEGAKSLYQQAIAADPNNAAAYRGQGLVLEHLGLTKQAARAFRQFLRLHPNDKGADKIRARLGALEGAP